MKFNSSWCWIILSAVWLAGCADAPPRRPHVHYNPMGKSAASTPAATIASATQPRNAPPPNLSRPVESLMYDDPLFPTSQREETDYFSLDYHPTDPSIALEEGTWWDEFNLSLYADSSRRYIYTYYDPYLGPYEEVMVVRSSPWWDYYDRPWPIYSPHYSAYSPWWYDPWGGPYFSYRTSYFWGGYSISAFGYGWSWWDWPYYRRFYWIDPRYYSLAREDAGRLPRPAIGARKPEPRMNTRPIVGPGAIGQPSARRSSAITPPYIPGISKSYWNNLPTYGLSSRRDSDMEVGRSPEALSESRRMLMQEPNNQDAILSPGRSRSRDRWILGSDLLLPRRSPSLNSPYRSDALYSPSRPSGDDSSMSAPREMNTSPRMESPRMLAPSRSFGSPGINSPRR